MPDPGLVGGPRALVLLALLGGPKHGYAIVQDVESLCGVRLGPGTLYGALTALEEQGLVAALPAQGRRRPYELTNRGRRTVADQANTWRDLATAAEQRLSARPGRRPRAHPTPLTGQALGGTA